MRFVATIGMRLVALATNAIIVTAASQAAVEQRQVSSVPPVADFAGQQAADDVPKHSIPQDSPCADQYKSLAQLKEAFDRGSMPTPKEITGSWVAIGDFLPFSQGRSVNCGGLRRGAKFEYVMFFTADSVEIHAIGASVQTAALKPTRGSLTFPFDNGGDANPSFRCRVTKTGTLACLVEVYGQTVEFKRMPVSRETVWCQHPGIGAGCQ
jgi:hypothetical protein